MPTHSTKPSEIVRAWHVVDAEDMVLGRLSTEVARLLRGKHKAMYSQHLDTGDHVVIVNAAKVVMSSNKPDRTFYHRHSGYPGGIRTASYRELLATKPEEVVRRSIKGMLPRGPLGTQMLRKLQVHAGPTHPHTAQHPQPFEIPGAKRATA